MIYGYIRVSHDRQAASGLGLAAQKKKIEEHAKTIPGPKLARIFRDAAVSASKKPLLARPQGWELDQALAKGDHVIFARLDRACRNVAEFAALLERWQKRGVYVHLLDLGVDTSSPVGQLVAGIMASIAQWESQRIGERIRDAKAVQRSQSKTTNGVPPIGWSIFRRRVVPDPAARRLGRQIVARRNRGESFPAIAAALNARKIRTPRGRSWTAQAVWRLNMAARQRWPIHPGVNRWRDR